MRNKIMIMVLLCALLVGVSTPGATKAEEDDGKYRTTYYGVDFVFNPETLTLTRESDDEQFVFDEQFRPYFDAKYNWMIVICGSAETGAVELCVVDPMYDFAVVQGNVNSTTQKKFIVSYRTLLSNTSPVYHEVIACKTNFHTVKFEKCDDDKMYNSDITYYNSYPTGDKLFVLFSNKDVQCIKTNPVESLWIYPWYRAEEYTFAEFCDDVGIANNLGVYEQYGNDVYIVQESRGEYPYRLLQFRYKISSLYFPYYYTNDVSSYIGISNPSETSQSVTVYEYGYSPDTGAWVKIEEKVGPVVYGVPIVELLDIYNGKIVYTNYDIYDGTTLQTVKYRATEKAEEPGEPSVTPTATPSNPSDGSGSSGGGIGGGTRPDIPEWDMEVDFGVDLDNVTLGDIPEVLENITESVKSFTGLIGVVPLMIGAVFSFLPTWCLWLVGVSFSLLVILVIVKIAKG